jgi:hypothetical protein
MISVRAEADAIVSSICQFMFSFNGRFRDRCPAPTGEK